MGSVWHQATQIHLGQQHIAAALARPQRIFQHSQKNLATGVFSLQVQSRNAKGLYQFLHNLWRQTLAQLRRSHTRIAYKALGLPSGGLAQQTEFVRPRPATGRADTYQQVERCG